MNGDATEPDRPDPLIDAARPALPEGRLLGRASWFDGASSRRRPVVMMDGHVQPGQAHELLLVEDRSVVARLAFADLRRVDGPERRLVLMSVKAASLARLEVVEADATAALLPLCPALAGPGVVRDARALTIVAWSLAAAASLALAVFFLIPLVAERLVPFVPIRLEARLGMVADQQMRQVLQATTCQDPAGLAALRDLTRRLGQAGHDAAPPTVEVWNSGIPNAFALPGGRIRLFKGLLDQARSPDEVAGVLAHEMGHVAHRDGLRELLRSSASGYLLGTLFGDIAGAGVVLGAGTYLLNASFTREAETMADAEALERLAALGRPATALADLLARITGESGAGIPAFLSTHPATPDRAARLAGQAEATGPALLDETSWQALRGICR